MSPDLVRSTVGRIHDSFSDNINELVCAAEEIRSMTDDDFNPLLIDILSPLFYDLSDDTDPDGFPTEVQQYRSMLAM